MIVDAKPALEDLPETAWGLIGELSGGEQGGVTTTYAEHAGWFILGVGRRAGNECASGPGVEQRQLQPGVQRNQRQIIERA